MKEKSSIRAKNKRAILLSSFILLIFALSTIPNNSFPALKIWTFDKLIHFFEYVVLGGLLFFFFLDKYDIPKVLILTVTSGAFIGGLDEVYQGAMRLGRDMSFYDWVADLAGVFIITLLSFSFYKFKKS